MGSKITASVIAIDGPAGVGKSEISASLADRLEYLFLDTGALYRSVTLLALRGGVALDDAERLGQLAQSAQIAFRRNEREDCPFRYNAIVNGDEVTEQLFTPEVDRSVSQVSAHQLVRDMILPLQRELSRAEVVVCGRDIGTVVLPHADLKIFLTASVEVRANRRFAQLIDRGQNPDFDTVLAEIKRRDQIDSSRKVSPLRAADDAMIVTTDSLSFEDELNYLYRLCLAPAAERKNVPVFSRQAEIIQD